MRSARTSSIGERRGRASAGALAGLALLLLSPVALAREVAGVHDVDDDDGGLEREAFGTHGLVRTRAETVSFDARARSVELSGDVRVDAPPFHLRSERVTLTRTKYGVEAEGGGRLTFCPCLGTPVTIAFDKAIVAPPGELILKAPKLEIYGVPILYLPWFWMRSNEKVGLLPPDLAYRGQDGLFVGGGVHLPWRDRGARKSLDLRGGGYIEGGFVADARLRTSSGSTKLRYDRLPGASAPALLASGSAARDADDGLLVDARGAAHGDAGGATIAWDVDALRGRRGVVAATDLDAATKPWDRATASGSVRVGPLAVESGLRAVTRRGGDLVAVDASGPFAALRASGALSAGITYDATIEGGALRMSGLAATASPTLTPGTLSYGRAELGALGAARFGPLTASVTARGAGNVAAEGSRDGGDRAAAARARLGLPLARAFGAGDEDAPHERNDPLVHVLEPFAEAAILHARGDGILGSLPGRGLGVLSGTAPVVRAGVTTALGRWGRREALELTVAGGAAFEAGAAGALGASGGALLPSTRPLARGRLAATLSDVGAAVETAHVAGDAASASGGVVVARVRIGRADGPRVLANVATREGIDPVLARALSDAPLEAPAGFLARPGTTGGAGLVIPWTYVVTTSFGADADATARELVAARAGFELRDRCRCVTLRANGAHRIGRSGVDVWIAIDFAADR